MIFPIIKDESTSEKILDIVPYVFAIIGIGCIIISGILFVRTRSFLKGAVSAQGTVVDLSWRLSGTSQSSLYVAYPLIRFTASDGTPITFSSPSGSSPPRFLPGDTLPVLYLPHDPHHAVVGSFFSLYLGELVTLFLGIIFGFFGALFIWITRKKKKVRTGP